MSGPLAGRGRGRDVFAPAEWESLRRTLLLSPREFEIVQAVFDDEIKAAVAARLGLSVHTIHTYFGRLYQKLGVSGRNELIVRIVGVFLETQHGPDANPRERR